MQNESTSDAPGTTHQPTENPVRWGAAFRALVELAKDNDDTTHVFRIVEALRGDSERGSVERMKQTEMGRKILDERRSLLDVLSNRDALRALPEGSLGRVYLAFMEDEGLSAEGLADAADEGYRGRKLELDPELETFTTWARDSHDLWHVLSGYGRDPLGELSLLGVLYSQIRSRGTGFIALLGLLQVPFEYPGAPSVRAVLQGFINGWRAESLMAQDWEVLLPLPIEQVRADLKIAPATYYEKSRHLHQASRS
ncbi:MAG: ubiquinone biosynthesis protein COQ4, partial [Myxococcota bacterium]